MPAIRKFFTLAQAVEAVLESPANSSDDDDDDDAMPDICILPPEDGDESEVEHVDEDHLCPDEPSEVCGQLDVFTGGNGCSDEAVSTTSDTQKRQSRSRTRTGNKRGRKTTKAARTTIGDSSDSSSEQRRRKLPKLAKSATKVNNNEASRKCRTSNRVHVPPSRNKTGWKLTDKFSEPMKSEQCTRLLDAHPELLTKTHLELFDACCGEDLFDHLKTQTELYAHRDKNSPAFSTTTEEIRQFLGIVLLSGYHTLPRERDYWSTADDMGCVAVKTTMTKNRFQELKKFFHVADNKNLAQSKIAKVKPVYDSLNSALMQFGVFEEKLSIDESMVPYYGHHGAKMFIRGKPIRFGYKIWMLCSSDGFPFQASIYCGKVDRPENVGLGEHVVLTFVDIVPAKRQHIVFFDNFFSSYSLMCRLRDMEMRATGTAREGRIGTAEMPNKREFKKSERGKYVHRCDGKVNIVRWSDNNVVTCMSNFDVVNPVVMIDRHVKGSACGEKAKIAQPRMIANYTSGMGGVDLMDRLLGAYRPKIKSKKWWWNLVINAFNMAVVAAWKLHCKTVPSSDRLAHIDFRREVTCGLLKGVPRRRAGGPTAPVPQLVRYDGTQHYLESTTQGRCIYCQSNTRKKCGKCGKRLHINCFELYHSRRQ